MYASVGLEPKCPSVFGLSRRVTMDARSGCIYFLTGAATDQESSCDSGDDREFQQDSAAAASHKC